MVYVLLALPLQVSPSQEEPPRVVGRGIGGPKRPPIGPHCGKGLPFPLLLVIVCCCLLVYVLVCIYFVFLSMLGVVRTWNDLICLCIKKDIHFWVLRCVYIPFCNKKYILHCRYFFCITIFFLFCTHQSQIYTFYVDHFFYYDVYIHVGVPNLAFMVLVNWPPLVQDFTPWCRFLVMSIFCMLVDLCVQLLL